MRVLAIVLSFALIATALWPQPIRYSHGDDVLWLDPNVNIEYECQCSVCELHDPLVVQDEQPLEDGNYCSYRFTIKLEVALRRTLDVLFHKSFVPWMFHPRGSDFEPDATDKEDNHIKRIQITIVEYEDLAALLPFEARSSEHLKDAYMLDLKNDNSVHIIACHADGAGYAMTTLTQLFFRHTAGRSYTTMAPFHIADAPRYVHRGLNLDVARSFYPVANIIRTIEAMADNKMNRLHLHITDSQAWPLEVPGMEELAGKGAYGPQMTYSVEDLELIISTGYLRGIKVYLEIDMPGHTASIYHSHPELIAAYNVRPDWMSVAAEPPSGNMKLNSTAVQSFTQTLLKSVLEMSLPLTYYYPFHTGGDEIKFDAYRYDDTLQTDNPDVIRNQLQAFIDPVHQQIRHLSYQPVVWEEMLLKYNLTLGNDVIVQTWLGLNSTRKVVEAGHEVIVSDSDYWYLDCGHGAWLDDDSGQDSNFNDWCSPRKSWRRIYSLDPVEGIPEHLQHLVLGGEVSLWSEQTDSVNLDVMLWPRTSAAAEVLWSGASDETGLKRNQSHASRRLAEMRERLVARRVRAEPVRMVWCEMEGGCKVS